MPKGLANLGNTCYLNSAIQCLSHVPELSNRLIRQPYTGPCELTKVYSDLIHSLWRTKDPVSPQAFHSVFVKTFPQFKHLHPHDVQEVILVLLDAFEKSLGIGFIQNIFNGTETQEVIYPNGKSLKEHDVTTIVLSPTEHNQTFDELMKKRETYEAFSGYIDDQGKEYNAAVKHTFISKMPHTLIISYHQYNEKYTVRVPQRYNGYSLFGLVVHYGTIHGGHYAAYVKHRGVWRYIDDDTVVDRDPPEAGEYYMAFFKKLKNIEST